jgi:phenylpyruvate tautomerase PptA (4-oxalocrotonate tautomerase family)
MMPTYVCSVPPKSLIDDQKDQIAAAIGRCHSEATAAPPFFVQVVIEESDTTRRYLGGQLSGAHIWVRGDIRAGRCEAHSCSPS